MGDMRWAELTMAYTRRTDGRGIAVLAGLGAIKSGRADAVLVAAMASLHSVVSELLSESDPGTWPTGPEVDAAEEAVRLAWTKHLS